MQKGWDATGLLSAHWTRLGGRDGLAAKTGITGATLSGYNTGRLLLGEKNARKIATALRVTIFDLGAPETSAQTEAEQNLIGHLQELQGELERLARAVKVLADAQRPALRRQLLHVLEGDRP